MPMFDATNSQLIYDDVDQWIASDPSLRDIVATCEELPEALSGEEFTHVRERQLSRQLVDRLCRADHTDGTSESIERLRRRRKALSKHVGRILTCIYFRLPGVHYTIEIDTDSQTVVYWEWQSVD